MKTNEEFRKLLTENNLTLREVASMIETPYETVRNWHRSPDAKGYRLMPHYAYLAVKLSIEQKSGEE